MNTHQTPRWKSMLLATALCISANCAVAGPLDQYEEAQLAQWFEDELYDIVTMFGDELEQPVKTKILYQHILYELMDSGDRDPRASEAHHEAHQYLTEAALRAEMLEAGTTLEDMVWQALQAADEYASRQRARSTALASSGKVLSDTSEGIIGPFVFRDDATTPLTAIHFVRDRGTRTIKGTRR